MSTEVDEPRYINPLEQLVIGHLFGRAPLTEPDAVELRDAVYEGPDGRLPHESPLPRRESMFQHQPQTPDPLGAMMGEATSPRQKQPNKEEIDRRRQVVLNRLGDGKANTNELAELLGLSQDNTLYLLARMRRLGLIQLVGKSRPQVYRLGTMRTTEPEPDPEPAVVVVEHTLKPQPLADRYLRFLADKRPERLLSLFESGQVEPTDELLEYIDASVLGLLAA